MCVCVCVSELIYGWISDRHQTDADLKVLDQEILPPWSSWQTSPNPLSLFLSLSLPLSLSLFLSHSAFLFPSISCTSPPSSHIYLTLSVCCFWSPLPSWSPPSLSLSVPQNADCQRMDVFQVLRKKCQSPFLPASLPSFIPSLLLSFHPSFLPSLPWPIQKKTPILGEWTAQCPITEEKNIVITSVLAIMSKDRDKVFTTNYVSSFLLLHLSRSSENYLHVKVHFLKWPFWYVPNCDQNKANVQFQMDFLIE